MKTIAVGLTILLAACGNETSSPQLSGTWGAVHLELRFDGDSALLEYDCATGVIQQRIAPDSRGRFTAFGFHQPGHGGPSFQDEVPVRLPARYDGVVSSSLLQLSVTLVDSGDEVGTFLLRRGKAGLLIRCL